MMDRHRAAERETLRAAFFEVLEGELKTVEKNGAPGPLLRTLFPEVK